MSTETRRKLRVLVVSTEGSDRQRYIQELFTHPNMSSTFEPPVFSPSVSSRTLRNRKEFFHIVNEAGLLPEHEWVALQRAFHENGEYDRDPGKFFDISLKDVPVLEGRRGSKSDIKLHYCKELWYKAKTINRGRSVLGCTLAHLIAMKRFILEDFDVMLEDNIRAPIGVCSCADIIRKAQWASDQWKVDKGMECHFRFLGWLGSTTNLEYLFHTHSVKRAYPPTSDVVNDGHRDDVSVFPYPLLRHLKEDFEDMDDEEEEEKELDGEENPAVHDEKASGTTGTHSRPGGNFIWGSYAYWISKVGYERLLETLRNDVGALLWKGKRARFYSVKPIDKVLPRQIMALCGEGSVHIVTHPAFFRAPMLPSKIHTKWDPEFCKSTEYQLSACGLQWDDLWLNEQERDAVQRRMDTGVWSSIHPIELVEHY